jgi:DNA-binding NarL/FixJ family response regulator
MVVRVVSIDDSELCLLGIQQAIEASELSWVRGIGSLQELRSIVDSQPFDILISELRIGSDDMLEYWQLHPELHDRCKLIFFTYNENVTHFARAAASGVWDFICKRGPIHRLIRACQSAADHVKPTDSILNVARQYMHSDHSFTTSETHPLTRRERQVLAHLALGLSNREIARSISVSLETVKEHVQNVLRKIKVNDRTAAAVWALRNGLPTFSLDPVTFLARTETTRERDENHLFG